MTDDEGAEAPGGLASAWRTITLVVMGIAGVGVLAALVLTLGEANRQRDRALAAQRHSYDVMILARTLQGTIARSEASLGRYVISTDQRLGRLYFEDWRRASETIGRLDKLTADNSIQSRHVTELRTAFQARGKELALTALNTNYGKNGQALSRFYQAREAPSLAAINVALTALIADERELLESRTSQAMNSVRRSTRVAKVLSVFGVLLVIGAIALGWVMVTALADRAIARAEAEAERERADELARAVAAATHELRVQEARLRQVQKMEAVGQLTGGIAHDFNNMLAVVLGGLELAQRSLASGSGDVAHHLDSAQDGAVRAAALTRRLLAFARETAINPEPIGAAALFADIADLIGRTLGSGVTVVLRDDSAGWCTRADRVQLENTLVNLAVNARDAMSGRGTLTIAAGHARLDADPAATRAAGDFLTIAVTDTGHGIAPEVLERVFEPFFTTKPVGQGTGLGLSQTFAFARQVGGDVTIASAVGRGTTVTMFLPRDHSVPVAPAQAPPPRRPAPVAAPAAPAAAATLSILVVEDDPRVLAATIGALAELGHRPVACDDPLRAATMLAAMERVDLILSDVLMPTLTGPELIATLAPPHAAVPVLFVTGFAGESGGPIDLGGRPVLRKPFTLAALEQAVLDAAGARPAHQIAAE
jgi:signal transduction histidine kinase